MIKSIIAIACSVFIATYAYSQELKVIEELSLMDKSAYARTHPVYVGSSDNKQLCAVIRVSMVLPEVKFDGTYFKQQSSCENGEYIVYVAPGCKKISVLSSSFFPFEYIFPKPAEEGATYRLVLGLPENSMSVVRIATNAKKANLEVAGQLYETESGRFELRLPKGEYKYVLSSTLPGFEASTGSFIIDDIYYAQRINLKTASRYKLNILADKNSRILIDGHSQDKKGSFQVDIEAGIHTVEAFAGEDERWNKLVEVDLTKGDGTADMNMRGNLKIVYPSNAQFEIIPKNGAVVPSSKVVKTGETVSLLGDYVIKVIKKNYEEVYAAISINPNSDVENYKISVISKGDNYFYGINKTRQDYKKAFKEYTKMAEKNDEIAQYKLGICYEKGYGTYKSIEKAKYYYQLASDAGHYEATYLLAQLTENSSVQKKLYVKAASQGNIYSMLIAGNIFFEEGNYAEAEKYYLMTLSERGNLQNDQINTLKSNCFYKLGEIYFKGLGREIDLLKAKDYYERAAAFDNYNAVERLADYLYYGYNGKPDKKEAVSHYRRIKDHLSEEGKLKMALYYYNLRDYDMVDEYLANLNTSKVKLPNDIGEIFYIMGGEMYNKNAYSSLHYYLSAQQLGVEKPRQLVRLGYMYLNGKGTSVDENKAKLYFQKASEMKDYEAICMLGYMYETGKGCLVNKEKAIFLYIEAGKNGYMRAYNNLGSLYAKLKEMEKAEKYWTLSANAGNTTAIKNLITFYKNRRNTQQENYWNQKLQKAKSGK